MTKEVFVQAFTLLAERFNRTFSDAVLAEYYKFLRSELTEDDFTRAARIIFRMDDFFPSPQRFVDAARGSTAQERAEEAWRQVHRWAKDGEYPDKQGLSSEMRLALEEVSLKQIGSTSVSQLDWLRRRFMTAFITADAKPLGLPSGDRSIE